MRILVLGTNYTPEVTGVAPFTAGLAEHLTDTGNEVTVATSFPHYPQWRTQPPYVGLWRAFERVGEVNVRRSRVFLPSRPGLLGRIAYDSSIAAGGLLNGVGARADLVICVTPPIQLAIVAGVLARAWRTPYILLVEDLAVRAALSVGLMRSRWIEALAKRLERTAYNLADRIVVISQGFADSLVHGGVRSDRLRLIPHWAHGDAVERQADVAIRREMGATEGDLLVMYAGNLGQKQGLIDALRAASLGADHNVFKLVLIGDGSERRTLERTIEEGAIRNARVLPLQPEWRLRSMLAAADVFLLTQRADVIDSVAPSKLLTYFSAGRPVLAAVHSASEAARLVNESRGGVIVTPESPEALLEAIEGMARSGAKRGEFGKAGRLFAQSRFTRDRVLAQWDDLIAETMNSGVYRRTSVGRARR